MGKKGGCEDLGIEVAEEKGVVIEGTAVIIVGAAVVIASGYRRDSSSNSMRNS